MQQSFVSAVSVSIVVLIPTTLLHLSFTFTGVEVTEAAIPVYAILAEHGRPILVDAFVVVLIITLGQTGAGLLQGLIERIEGAGILVAPTHQTMSFSRRLIFIATALLVSVALASLGVVALIGKGYGTLALGFGLIYIAPLIFLGSWRLFKKDAIYSRGLAGRYCR